LFAIYRVIDKKMTAKNTIYSVDEFLRVENHECTPFILYKNEIFLTKYFFRDELKQGAAK
jgi:hypothetical protein